MQAVDSLAMPEAIRHWLQQHHLIEVHQANVALQRLAEQHMSPDMSSPLEGYGFCLMDIQSALDEIAIALVSEDSEEHYSMPQNFQPPMGVPVTWPTENAGKDNSQDDEGRDND